MKKIKRVLVLLVCVLLAVSSLPVSASASSIIGKEPISEVIKATDFSREPSAKEKELLIKYYQQDSDRVFNEAYGRMIYERDQKYINSLSDTQKAQLCSKEYAEKDAELHATRGSTSLGTYGDILVTYSISSLGLDLGIPGHAAIVHTNSNKTVESFPRITGREDGVRIYTNTWGTKSRVYGIRVRNATLSDYRNAANYAISQANLKKPYNWNYFNKGTTSKFYCSQLVWRAWKNQGFEIDRMNLGNYEPVSPAELVGARGTYVFYHR